MAERTEDLNLPLSVVTRIIKDALPSGVNVSKEARVAMARAASVFVLYATATANNYALKSKRRTLAAMDVVEAMKDMEFEEFIEPLKAALAAYRQQQPPKTKRASKGQQQQVQEEEFVEPPSKKSAHEYFNEYADAGEEGDDDGQVRHEDDGIAGQYEGAEASGDDGSYFNEDEGEADGDGDVYEGTE